VNTETDTSNCGGCDTVCQADSGTPTCDSGECGVRCESELEACDATCVNLSSDPNHCGSCNNDCVGGLICLAGSCVLDL
jgi:hypothetical protein